MPNPKKDEKEKDFISRCVPYVKKEHPEWEIKQVTAVCYSMWRRAKGIKDEPPKEKSTAVRKATA